MVAGPVSNPGRRPAARRRQSDGRTARATIGLVAFARWDPVRDLLAIQLKMERLPAPAPQGWVPAADLCETADAYIVTAELPGVPRQQIRIDVHDGQLTVHGRRDARGGVRAVSPGGARTRRVQPLVPTAPHDCRRPDLRRAQGRRADHRRAEGRAARPAARRRLLGKPPCGGSPSRSSSSSPGVVAGLVVSGRMRGTSDAEAVDQAATAPTRSGAPRSAGRPGRRPRLHARRRADHRGGHQHRVAAGGAPVRRRRLPTIRSSSTSSAMPTTCSAAATATSRASVPASSSRADGYVLTNSHVVGEGAARGHRRPRRQARVARPR